MVDGFFVIMVKLVYIYGYLVDMVEILIVVCGYLNVVGIVIKDCC